MQGEAGSGADRWFSGKLQRLNGLRAKFRDRR